MIYLIDTDEDLGLRFKEEDWTLMDTDDRHATEV